MSLAYRFLYAAGFTPWEQMAQRPIADQTAELFAREEAGREPPYGSLDLGCGSGIWAVALARLARRPRWPPRRDATDNGVEPRSPRASSARREPG